MTTVLPIEQKDHDMADERQQVAARTTWISVVINLVLTVLQVVVGIFSKSQALIADGLHSLSDLVADFVVLFANRHSHQAPDEGHHYGHARYETVASLWLGVILLVVGLGMLLRAGERLTAGAAAPTVHSVALWVACATLFAKEGLFRYMLKEAERVRSSMLVANAWHARSDAASSLVVALGIAGNLLGYTFLDALAASLVGFMVARMGWKFGWDALQDLSDAAPDAETVAAIRQTLEGTVGVQGVHELRTRKMGDMVLVDAHVLVNPTISVSEGHFIAEQARRLVLANHPVLDVLVHVDPEDDNDAKRSAVLPDRNHVKARLLPHLPGQTLREEQLVLHYLDGQLELDLFLNPDDLPDPAELDRLKAALATLAHTTDHIRDIRLHHSLHKPS